MNAVLLLILWNIVKRKKNKMKKEYYYRIIRYNDNYLFPIKFKTREEADDFIFKNNLHAYITIIPTFTPESRALVQSGLDQSNPPWTGPPR